MWQFIPKSSYFKQIVHTQIIVILAMLFGLGVILMLWHVDRLQSDLVESMALADASLYNQALTEFRTLYTREVVERVRTRGIEVLHNYQDIEGAIPLPATLSIELGQRIGLHQSGAEARLYSAYPYPWRLDTGGLQDTFAREAWEFFRRIFPRVSGEFLALTF